MKRKYGTIGMLSLLLCACAGKNPTLSSSAPISLASDSASSSVSSDLSLPSPSSSVFSETVSSPNSGTKEEEPIVSLALAKKTALEGQDRVNDVGVYESDRKAELEVRLLASLDAITTKAGYGNRYKLLVANDEGSLYLKVGAEIYNRLKSQSGSCYRVRGTVSLYCGEAEITVDEMPEKIEDRAYSIDFEERTIEEIYTHLSQVTTNTKGCGFSSLTSFQGKYLGAMDDAVLLFYDGDKIVQVHGDSKVKNGLNENEVYRIFGAMTMFNYKPGVEYVSSERIQSGEEYAIDPTKLETIDRNCYSTYYEVDREDSYPEYSSFYQELKVFRGYVTCTTKTQANTWFWIRSIRIIIIRLILRLQRKKPFSCTTIPASISRPRKTDSPARCTNSSIATLMWKWSSLRICGIPRNTGRFSFSKIRSGKSYNEKTPHRGEKRISISGFFRLNREGSRNFRRFCSCTKSGHSPTLLSAWRTV